MRKSKIMPTMDTTTSFPPWEKTLPGPAPRLHSEKQGEEDVVAQLGVGGRACVQGLTSPCRAVGFVGEGRPEDVGGVEGHHAGLEQAGLGLLWKEKGGGGHVLCTG